MTLSRVWGLGLRVYDRVRVYEWMAWNLLLVNIKQEFDPHSNLLYTRPNCVINETIQFAPCAEGRRVTQLTSLVDVLPTLLLGVAERYVDM